MKQPSSQLPKAEESEYILLPDKDFPYLTLNEAATETGLTSQRLSRLLRILQIPIYRRGYTLFLDRKALARVHQAVKDEEVKPGRKRRS